MLKIGDKVKINSSKFTDSYKLAGKTGIIERSGHYIVNKPLSASNPMVYWVRLKGNPFYLYFEKELKKVLDKK